MLTRRALFAMAAAAVLDPERLLYVPGKKHISIPRYEYYPFDCFERPTGFSTYFFAPGRQLGHALLGNGGFWEVIRSNEQGARLICRDDSLPRLKDLARQYRAGLPWHRFGTGTHAI
jgi:hypothetical protein